MSAGLRAGGLAVVTGGYHYQLDLTRCDCMYGRVVGLKERFEHPNHIGHCWSFAELLACRRDPRVKDIWAGEERYLRPLPPPDEVRSFDRTRELEDALEREIGCGP
jgi:hypothetical protein